MTKAWMLAGVAALSLSACDDNRNTAEPASEAAAEAAGDETLATGLGDNAKFAAAIKAAGLEAALAGPTPYTHIATMTAISTGSIPRPSRSPR